MVDAIVLAGGRAVRLGGLDKARLVGPDGRTALRVVLDACGAVGVDRVAIVGPPDRLSDADMRYDGEVHVLQESPPVSGPARAVAAGLDWLVSPGPRVGQPAPDSTVLVLAVDIPRVADATLALVRRGVSEDALVIEADGRPQWLLGLFRALALQRACAGLPPVNAARRDPSMRELVTGLTVECLQLERSVADDIDTPDDLARLQFRAGSA